MSDPMVRSLKDRAISGAGWSFLDNAVQQALSLVIFVILGRLLSPALFGIVSTALVFVLLMRSTVLNSISTGLVTLRNPTSEDYDTGFWLCVVISLIAFGFINILAGPLSQFYGLSELLRVVRATSIIVLISGLSYSHIGWARRNFRFRSLAMRNSTSTAVGGAVGIVVALAGYGLSALILNQVIASVLGLWLLWRAIPWRPKRRFSLLRARAILSTALPLGVNQSLQFISQNFDTALVTFLLGPSSGGLYAAAKRVVGAIQIALWQPIASVALPTFAEVSGDPIRFGNAAVRVARLVMALTAPLFIGIALTAQLSIAVLFGPKWEGAAPIMAVLAAFGLFIPSLGILNQIVMAMGRAKLILIFTLLQMLLSVISIALVGKSDLVLLALCLSVPIPIVFMLTLITVARITTFPIKRYLIGIGVPLICTLAMAAAVWSIPPLNMGALTQLIISILVGGTVYVFGILSVARQVCIEVWSLIGPLLPASSRDRNGLQ
tara:strand:- start:171 stop:1652 length:1482 start_codon:yes stop_codon:yes gene_type:complete